MNTNRRFNAGKVGFVSCSALFGVLSGCVYTQPPAHPVQYAVAPRVEAAVAVSYPGVEIRAASDFYEPLTPVSSAAFKELTQRSSLDAW